MLKDYLTYTSGQESPVIFHKWVCLSMAASCLERNIYLDRGYYKVYPNLYVLLVADSAARKKSTAIDIGKETLSNVTNSKVTVYEGQITLQAFIKELCGEKLDEITGRYVPKSRILLLAPELSVLLHDKQAPELIHFLTDLYTCKAKPWHYKTKTSGEFEIHSPCINFLGASTAEWMARGVTYGDFGGGFMGRCMFVVPREPRKMIAHPTLTDEQKAAFARVVDKLSHLRTLRGQYFLSEEGKKYYEHWYVNQPLISVTDKMKGYYERKPETILKLALIKTAIDDAVEVGVGELQWAIDTLKECEQGMSSAFQFIGTEENVLGELVLHYLDTVGGKERYIKVLSYMSPRLKGIRQFNEILDMLNKQEKIKRYVRGTTGGAQEEFLVLHDANVELITRQENLAV